MTLLVIGGGITGQLVQRVIPSATLLDWRSEKQGHKPQTRRYGANYLWHPLDGIACRPFPVVTRIDNQIPTPELIAAYKEKVHRKGQSQDRWGLQFQPETTGWDFADWPTPRIQFNGRVVLVDPVRRFLTLFDGTELHYDYLVSTIPLYALLPMIDDTDADMAPFRFQPIYIKVTPRPPDAPFPPEVMYVNYQSSPDIAPYRITDRDGERHYEGLTPMGTIPTRKLVPGKIYPHPEASALRDNLEAEFGITCFGRYARWEPEELIHDTYTRIVSWAWQKGFR